MNNTVIRRPDILLPAAGIDLKKWAVVAVDQYTSEPEYWQAVESEVQNAPSTYALVLPEIYLSQAAQRLPGVHDAMKTYLAEGILQPLKENSYILTERITQSGSRIGLMVCVDLEAYSYEKGANSLIRPTEGTVTERVPPRVAIRRGASIELPHILMLLDDPQSGVIEPLYADRAGLEKLYDTELMQGGGRLRGYLVDGAHALKAEAALDALYEGCKGFFLAMGDGNHSLAAAKAYWEEVKATLSAEERENHPARFALCELVNLHSEAIQFEPIHRIVTGIEPAELLGAWENYLQDRGYEIKPGDSLRIFGEGIARSYGFAEHPLGLLQAFLDDYLAGHPGAAIDYIHGDETLRRLSMRPDALGFMPCAFPKEELFPYIRRHGVLPRKTFSMGHACEKRYYFEARRIVGES